MLVSIWDETRAKRLRHDFTVRRLSDGQIAAEWNKELGADLFTRNMVIGKRRRLGIEREGVCVGGNRRLASSYKKCPRPLRVPRVNRKSSSGSLPPMAIEAEIIPDEPHVAGRPILQLESGQCRYGVTDDKPLLFCGEVTKEGSSYCPFHTELCIDRTKRTATVKDLHRFARSFDRFFIKRVAA